MPMQLFRMLLWFSITGFVVSGFFAARYISSGENYIIEFTPAAVSKTSAQIDEFTSTLITGSATEKHRAWSDKVKQALDAEDMELVRAYLKQAPKILGGAWKEQYDQALSRGQGALDPHELALDLALAWLPALLAHRYSKEETELASALRVAEDIAKNFPDKGVNSFAQHGLSEGKEIFLFNDIRDFSLESLKFLSGRDVDHMTYVLSAIALGLTSQPPSQTERIAASFLKTALQDDRLNPSYVRALAEKVDKAVPPDVLRKELQRALEGFELSHILEGDVTRHFKDVWLNSLDHMAFGLLLEELAIVAQIFEAVPYNTAFNLLGHVDRQTDLFKMLQLSIAAPDMITILDRQLGADIIQLSTRKMIWRTSFIAIVLGLMASLLLLGILLWVRVSYSGKTSCNAPKRGR